MATLEQILNFRNLTGVIQAVKSGIPNPLPDAYLNATRKVSGNKAEYYKITGTRQVARIAQYGSPAARQNLREIDLVPVTLIHAFESQQWPLALTLALTKMTDLSKDHLGEQTASYWSKEFKKRFSNLRVTSAMQALFNGIIYVDSSGNVLPNSTGNAYSINFQVPAGNQSQLNVFGAGNLLTAGWQTASTDIITQLIKIKAAALKLTGYEITTAYYSDEIPSYIGANTIAQQYLVRNPAMNQAYIGNPSTVPDGFGGIKHWIYAGQTFYDDKSGNHQNILGANKVVFTPDHDPEWFEFFEGSFPVPRSVLPQMNQTAAEVLSNVSEEFGMFGYGQLALNPPQVEQFAGDTFLPVLKVPGAIFQATVNF